MWVKFPSVSFPGRAKWGKKRWKSDGFPIHSVWRMLSQLTKKDVPIREIKIEFFWRLQTMHFTHFLISSLVLLLLISFNWISIGRRQSRLSPNLLSLSFSSWITLLSIPEVGELTTSKNYHLWSHWKSNKYFHFFPAAIFIYAFCDRSEKAACDMSQER